MSHSLNHKLFHCGSFAFCYDGLVCCLRAPDLELRLPRLASSLTQGLELGASLNTSAVLGLVAIKCVAEAKYCPIMPYPLYP